MENVTPTPPIPQEPLTYNQVLKQMGLLVEYLATNPKFRHAVGGYFSGFTGSYIRKVVVGDNSWEIKKDKLQPGDELWPYNSNLRISSEYGANEIFTEHYPTIEEFKARVFGFKIPDQNYCIKLIFSDRGKLKPTEPNIGVFTSYIMIIPKDEISDVLDLIKRNYNILIQLFQRLFSEYDRSDGKLMMDEHKPGLFIGAAQEPPKSLLAAVNDALRAFESKSLGD